ncbi:MAG: 50S ribosomal protein L17 [Sandaracinaceae bacterium]
MRHRKAGRKFGRNTSHRRAMFRNLAGNLVLHERIETTEAKAKELRRIAERLVTRCTRLKQDLTVDLDGLEEDERARVIAKRTHVQRQIARFLPRFGAVADADGLVDEVDLVHKLFHEIAPRYVGRPGGYTRITKMIARRGDNAPMAIIEFLDESEAAPAPAKAADASAA